MEKEISYKTVNRKKILDYLIENKERTVSAKDIQTHLNELDLSVNVSTVYRYLDKLTKDGIINKFSDNEGKQAVFQYTGPENDCTHHIHLQCVKCGSVTHLDCGFMSEISEHVMKHHQFSIICKNSVLYGICSECSKEIY